MKLLAQQFENLSKIEITKLFNANGLHIFRFSQLSLSSLTLTILGATLFLQQKLFKSQVKLKCLTNYLVG